MYAHTATAAPQHDTISTYLPLVRQIAVHLHRRLPPHVEVDDLVQDGVVGLLTAAARFEEGRSVPFEGFVKHRIRGAILDALRGADFVPRSVRRKAQHLEAASEAVRRRTGDAPTRTELAAQLHLSSDELTAMQRDAQIRTVCSLDRKISPDSDTPLGDCIANDDEGPLARVLSDECRALVLAEIERLPERESQVITLYYLRGWSLKQIGAQLGVTESRACQLRGRSVRLLKKRLTDILD